MGSITGRILKNLRATISEVLKQVVGQHKMWNDVMFWFSQMIFYNAHIPLLIRQTNDLEENPSPTIFDVIDPTRTICADHSEGNEALFGENADFGLSSKCRLQRGVVLSPANISWSGPLVQVTPH
ncbi:uncharacterized protein [Pocillopora verrucosa]|uniref:uncharacterized protein n=1 Tax=Pocillopora verrucosa TaxID=203993 RepID=UPI003340D519